MNLNGRLYALEQEASGQKRPPCAACNGSIAVTPVGWDGTRESLRCAVCSWPPGLVIDLGGGNPV